MVDLDIIPETEAEIQGQVLSGHVLLVLLVDTKIEEGDLDLRDHIAQVEGQFTGLGLWQLWIVEQQLQLAALVPGEGEVDVVLGPHVDPDKGGELLVDDHVRNDELRIEVQAFRVELGRIVGIEIGIVRLEAVHRQGRPVTVAESETAEDVLHARQLGQSVIGHLPVGAGHIVEQTIEQRGGIRILPRVGGYECRHQYFELAFSVPFSVPGFKGMGTTTQTF